MKLGRFLARIIWFVSGTMMIAGCPKAPKVQESQVSLSSSAVTSPKVNSGYFNTARTQKIAGVLLNDPSEINEVAGFSNAVAFWTEDLSRLKVFLQKNKGRMLPFVELRSFIFDPKTGVVRENYISALKKLIQAIASSHSGPVIFYVDEPFWNIRMSCHDKNLSKACAEVRARYANTLSQLRIAGQLLRQGLPGSGMFDVEAFAELAIQQSQWGQVVMLDEAEYLGFDCYGNFNSCGGGTYAGVSVSAQPMATYIDWISNAINSLESKNPMGRKILLVPGAFVNTVNFTSEQQTIDQLNAYLAAFNSCRLCAGIAPFLWGNLPGIQDTVIGARSLPNVRATMINILRGLSQQSPSSLPTAMTLVGGYQVNQGPLYTFLGTSRKSVVGTPATGELLGVPDYQIPKPAPPMATLIVPSGANGQVYVTEVGMDSCSLTIGNGASRPLAANSFSITPIPNLTRTTTVTAKCTSAGQSYSRYFLFKVK